MTPEHYNIRVYGICLNEKGQVLLTDERRGGLLMTKFPGGGHHFGEGLGDTVKREFIEETNTEIQILGLYYANDFLQISAFDPKDQLISIYYLVSLAGELQVPIANKIFDFEEGEGACQTFRWVALRDLDEDDFRFPVDKIVVGKLLTNQVSLLGLMGDGDFACK